jgi:hypothetical protein
MHIPEFVIQLVLYLVIIYLISTSMNNHMSLKNTIILVIVSMLYWSVIVPVLW